MVYFAGQNAIETVIADGRKVVDKGRVPGLGEEKLAWAADDVRFARRTELRNPTFLRDWEER